MPHEIYEDLWRNIMPFCTDDTLWSLKDVSAETRRLIMSPKKRFVRGPVGLPIFVKDTQKIYFATINSSFYYVLCDHAGYCIIDTASLKMYKVPKKDISVQFLPKMDMGDMQVHIYILCDNMLLSMYSCLNDTKTYNTFGKITNVNRLYEHRKLILSSYEYFNRDKQYTFITDNLQKIIVQQNNLCISKADIGKCFGIIIDNILILDEALNFWASYLTEL